MMASLRAHVLPHNPALLGVYDFAVADYRRLMQRWLAEVPDEGALLFCHPGDPRPAEPKSDADPIATARLREADYLGGDLFVQDLAAANVVLGRVWQTPHPGAA